MQIIVIVVVIINNKTHSLHTFGYMETLAWVTVPRMGQVNTDNSLREEKITSAVCTFLACGWSLQNHVQGLVLYSFLSNFF